MLYGWIILLVLSIYCCGVFFWLSNITNKWMLSKNEDTPASAVPNLVQSNFLYKKQTGNILKDGGSRSDGGWVEGKYIMSTAMIIGPLNIGQTNDLNEDKSNGMEKDVINGNTEHTSNRYIPTDDNNNGTEESITGKEYVWSLDDNGSFYYSNQTLTEVPNPKLTKLSSEAFNALDLLSMSDSKVLEDYEFSHMFENKCRWPMLSTTSSDYVALLKHVRHFNCQSKNSIEKLVIQSRDGSFFIGKPENSVISNNINCWSQKLTGSLRPNVKKWKFTGPKVNLPLETHIHIHMDQFVITCIEMNDSLNGNVEGKIVFEEPFASLSNVKKYLKETVRATKFNPSISILAIDSVSRNQFHRHMVKSAKFLAKNKFHLLQGYTKVGDNSAVNMMATFGGLTYDEKARWMTDRVSPSISLGKTNLSQSLIKHKDKFIWQKYREKGCITQYNDDISNSGYGIFQYNPFRGFEAPPTHYYFRPYYEYLYQKLAATGSKCLNGKYLLRIFLNIWERFSHTFAFKCHFSFNFLTKFTHDSANNLELFDEPLVEALERMKYNGVFEETIIIIMGDHGQRVSSIQKTYYGRIEERMPLMAIYLPDSFTKQYKEAVQNLRYNKNRLTSNFDIYETILDIVDTNRLKNMHKDEVSKEKGMSLFRNQISVDRNCFDAKVPENFCVCQENVKAINVSEDISKDFRDNMMEEATHFLLTNYFENTFNNSHFKKCVKYFDYQIISKPLFMCVTPIVRFGARYPKAWRQFLQNHKESDVKREMSEMTIEVKVTLFNDKKNIAQIHLIASIESNDVNNQFKLNVEPYLKSGCNGSLVKRVLSNVKDACSSCF